MSSLVLLEIIGWIGTVLVVLSLAQARVWRFRVMNFAGAVLATFYNAVLDIWPFATMNGIIAVIDAYWMVRLRRESRVPSEAYELVEVNHDDAFLEHFLKIHGDDARRYYPHFEPADQNQSTILVMRGDETVGLVVISDSHDGTAHVLLDYVTARFRDFSPGKFVYADSGLFDRLGVNHVESIDGDPDYLKRMGFRRDGTVWTRPVHPTTRGNH